RSLTEVQTQFRGPYKPALVPQEVLAGCHRTTSLPSRPPRPKHRLRFARIWPLSLTSDDHTSLTDIWKPTLTPASRLPLEQILSSAEPSALAISPPGQS